MNYIFFYHTLEGGDQNCGKGSQFSCNLFCTQNVIILCVLLSDSFIFKARLHNNYVKYRIKLLLAIP